MHRWGWEGAWASWSDPPWAEGLGPGPGNFVICDLASVLSLGFLLFSLDLLDCCILPWLLFLHLSLKKRCFLNSTLIFSTLHSLRTSEVHTPDVQTLGIKVKVGELGRTGSSHPSWVACWLWTLEISLPVKWGINAYHT